MVTSLSLPPFNYFFINFFTFTLLFIILLKISNSRINNFFFFLYGWSFGFGYFITNLYWISISLTFDQNFEFLIPVTIVLIPALLAIFYGLFSYFFLILKTKKILSSFFIFSLLFSIFEFLRGTILTGFPWNLIAYSFLNQLEIISVTSIIGTYGFNLFCISLFTCPALLILKTTNKHIFVIISIIILFCSFYFYGSYSKKKFYALDKIENDFKVRAIGSNISLDRFYSNDNPVLIIEELIKISEPNFDEKTLFIWPEGILPDISQKELKNYKWLFEDKFSKNHLLAIGINSKTKEGDDIKVFNTLSLYDNELNLLNSYKKINLVPFGEFLPFEKTFSKIGLKTITNKYQSYSKGDQRGIIEIKKENFLLKFLPLICYEIIYSGNISTDSDYDLIINISEDGWFGSSIGPKQHFAHSIFRSVENGKYVVRSANNGISAVINPIGVIEKSLNLKENGYIEIGVIRKIQPTVFSKFGNKIFGFLILLYIFIIFSITFKFSFNRIRTGL